MSRLRRAGAPISQINVVPYLDVMLVLLVIFMITAPLLNRGVVDLPSVGDATVNPQKSDAWQIEYGADKSFTLIHPQSGFDESNLSVEDLIGYLDGADRLYVGDLPVVVAADKKLLYGDVTELLGDLKAAGFIKVGLKAESGKR